MIINKQQKHHNATMLACIAGGIVWAMAKRISHEQ